MTTDPTRATDRDRAEYALRQKLNRLLLVRHELWVECQPIPQALEQVIAEVRQSLGLEPPLPDADP